MASNKKHIKLIPLMLFFCMLIPQIAFADTGLVAASETGAGESQAASEAVSTLDNPVQARVIDPTENGITYKLYDRWSDDTPEGMGAYHWNEIELAVYVDEAGIRYYFTTNPVPDKAASELFCTLIWVPENADGGVANVPGYVQLVDAGGSYLGGVREVVELGYHGGTSYIGAQGSQNMLRYWYAKDANDEELAETHSGENNGILKESTSGKNFTSIIIPKTLKKIGDSCFYQYGFLKSVTFEEGSQLEEIGWRAFIGCSSLENIDLPDTVTNIGSIKYCRYGERSTDYTDENLGKYVTQEYGNTLVENFDDRVTTLTSTGQAFAGCTALKSIHMPASCEYVGQLTFNDCTSLESFEFPKSLKSVLDVSSTQSTVKSLLTGSAVKNVTFAEGSAVTQIEDRAFNENTTIESVVLPDSLKKIGEYAFNGCTNLESMLLPEGLEEIGTQALNGCTSLESITIPASVMTLGTKAFGSTGLKAASFAKGSNIQSLSNAFQGSGIVSFAVPDSVSVLGKNEFASCKSLIDLDLGSGCNRLEGNALVNAPLEKLTFRHSGEITFTNDSYPSLRFNKSGGLNGEVVDALDIYFTGPNASIIDAQGTNGQSFKSSESQKVFPAKKLNVYSVNNAIRNWFTTDGGTSSNESNFNAITYTGITATVSYAPLSSAATMSEICTAEIAESVSFDGVAKTPAVAVLSKDSSVTLTEGTDYEVTYSDNGNAGTAKAIVKGLGAYYLCEPLEVEFTIEPADISKAVVAEIPDQTLAVGEDGAAAACEPQVSASITLVEGGEPVALTADDFDVSYAGNALPGTATVTLTGKGNYTGTATATFTIVASDEDKTAAASAENVIAEKLAAATDEGIAACDEAALSAVADALEAYNGLTDVQKTQVGGSTASALIAAQQKVADAKAKAADEALKAAEADRDQKAQEATEAKAQVEQLKADVAAAKASAAAGVKLAKPALTAKTKSKKKGKLTAAWSKVAGADGYELKVGKKTYTVKGGAKVSKTVKAKKGKKVKVQVRAFKKQGDNTVYSAWSKAKKVKVKK